MNIQVPRGRFLKVSLLFCFWTLIQAAMPASQAARADMCDWGLKLPANPVSRRASRYMTFKGSDPIVLSEMQGAGCIRRLWITGINIGRDVVLRIYFDGEKVPYVEAPLSDFFGVMHNLSEKNQAYRINTPFLDVKPKNGMTCWLPMPFAAGARIEIVGAGGETSLYYTIDWHEYPEEPMTEPMRFCARWRRECPTVPYADEFLMLDADGPGRLIGFVYSVDMLNSRQIMRWSHAGADHIYLDGEGAHPSVLYGGVGGEDTFGTSYSGGDYVAQSNLFSDLPYYTQKDPQGDKQKLVGYRFFVHDAVQFQKSIYMRFCCREHDIASMVYWYSASPVRPFCTMPPRDDRLPGVVVKRKYDLPLPEAGTWWITGRFKPGFDAEPPTDLVFDPNQHFHDAKWIKYASKRGFVEFNDHYGPPPSNDHPTAEGVCFARAVLESPADATATFRLGWDEQLTIRVNNADPQRLENHPHFQSRTLKVPLQKGANVVAIKLTNSESVSRGSWAFSFSATLPDGTKLQPHAPEAAPAKPCEQDAQQISTLLPQRLP